MADSAREIENLLYTYAERIDAGDLDGVADLFRHGRIHGQEDPQPHAVFEGRDAVRRLYGTAIRTYDDTGTPKTKHVTTNAIIEVDDDARTATARSSYLVTQATADLPLQVIITGHYRDSFHRPVEADGRWCFETRVMFIDQTGDLSHHLKW